MQTLFSPAVIKRYTARDFYAFRRSDFDAAPPIDPVVS
jgi:hypothetical protein